MPITRISEQALRVLDAAPGLTIHSVFDSAVNLRAGQRLITCTARVLSAPHGVELTAGDLLRLREHGRRRPGAALRWNPGQRRMTAREGRLVIAAAPTLTVFGALMPVSGSDGWERAVTCLTRYLAQLKPATGFGHDWPALCGDGRFDAAVTSLAAGRADDAVLYWLGRGPGLTPSGDDVLAGAIATLWSTGALAPSPLASLRRALDRAARERTTEISAEYLYYACRGMVAGPLRSLLAALHHADTPAAIAAVNRLRGYGHTSGMDSILGVIAASRHLAGSGPAVASAGESYRGPGTHPGRTAGRRLTRLR